MTRDKDLDPSYSKGARSCQARDEKRLAGTYSLM